MLIGDFNARTGSLPDYVSFDSNDHIPFPPDYIVDTELPRSSKDSMCNNYGRELLDLCKASNLRMTNGRFGEDRGIGSFTCFTSRGQSTVDYHILSESLLGRIKNFVVEPPSDISDHCPLITTLYESSYSTHEFVKLRNSSSVLLEDIMLRETPGYIDQPPSPQQNTAGLPSQIRK